MFRKLSMIAVIAAMLAVSASDFAMARSVGRGGGSRVRGRGGGRGIILGVFAPLQEHPANDHDMHGQDH